MKAALLTLARVAAPAIAALRHQPVVMRRPRPRPEGTHVASTATCPVCARPISLLLGPARDIAPRRSRPMLGSTPRKITIEDFFGATARTVGASANSVLRPLMAALAICAGLALTGCASLQPLSTITGSTDGDNHQIRVEFANSRDLPPCTTGFNK